MEALGTGLVDSPAGLGVHLRGVSESQSPGVQETCCTQGIGKISKYTENHGIHVSYH